MKEGSTETVPDVSKKQTLICVKQLKFQNIFVATAKPLLTLIDTKIVIKKELKCYC